MLLGCIGSGELLPNSTKYVSPIVAVTYGCVCALVKTFAEYKPSAATFEHDVRKLKVSLLFLSKCSERSLIWLKLNLRLLNYWAVLVAGVAFGAVYLSIARLNIASTSMNGPARASLLKD